MKLNNIKANATYEPVGSKTCTDPCGREPTNPANDDGGSFNVSGSVSFPIKGARGSVSFSKTQSKKSPQMCNASEIPFHSWCTQIFEQKLTPYLVDTVIAKRIKNYEDETGGDPANLDGKRVEDGEEELSSVSVSDATGGVRMQYVKCCNFPCCRDFNSN